MITLQDIHKDMIEQISNIVAHNMDDDAEIGRQIRFLLTEAQECRMENIQ